MSLRHLRPVRPFPVASGPRQERPYVHMNPRAAAVQLLEEHIRDGKAGLDPYDETIFLFDAHPNELVWAASCLDRVGVLMNRPDRGYTGPFRFRAVLEADVRLVLGLDDRTAPTMDDEPLASRAVSSIHDYIDAAKAAQPKRSSCSSRTLAWGWLEPMQSTYPNRRATVTVAQGYLNWTTIDALTRWASIADGRDFHFRDGGLVLIYSWIDEEVEV